jgi:hypothetical protein
MKVFVYVNAWKKVGDTDHIKVFATAEAAKTWLEEHDPNGTAYEQEVSDGAAKPESDSWSC